MSWCLVVLSYDWGSCWAECSSYHDSESGSEQSSSDTEESSAREVSRVAQAAQAQAIKSAGSSAIVDLTQDKVKNVNHYHILKPQANMDKGTHLKRKFDAIEAIIAGNIIEAIIEA